MATGNGTEAALEMLYTFPNWRGRNVASSLMYFYRDMLRGRGAAAMRVNAPRSNAQAMKLFEKLGFEWIGTNKLYPTMIL